MNTSKFDNKGVVYAKARPGYPAALFSYLQKNGTLRKDAVVADVGSGTGIFTTQISAFAKKVFAVEPNEDMRRQAELQYAKLPGVVSIDGTAEQTSLPDASADLITVAQAFHWFDRTAFQTECRRLLKPHGKVLLVWNDRDTSSELIRDNFEINRRFCPSFKGSSNGIDFSPESFYDFFLGAFETPTFENNLSYDLEAFLYRNLSSSYSPREGDPNYEPYSQAIKELFLQYQKDGVVQYPYITRCYLGTV